MRQFFGGLVAVLALVLGSLVIASPARADTVTWDGELSAGAATWLRPSCLSAGTGEEWWQKQAFRVDADGMYELEMISSAPVEAGGSSPDGFFLLYEAPFDPAAPTVNCIADNDDGASALNPRLVQALTAGTDYVLVTTQCCDGITPAQAMTYTNQITGPGAVTLTQQILAAPTESTIPAATDTVQIIFRLSAPPAANVTIPLVSADPGLLSVPASVTITPAQWSTGVPVSVTRTTPVAADATVAIDAGPAVSADPAFAGQTLGGLGVTLIAPVATATTLAAAPSSPVFGDEVVLTATVDVTGAIGAVDFFADGLPLGSAPLVDGAAALAVTDLAAGARTLTAEYSGDPERAASTSDPVGLVVSAVATSTRLTISARTSTLGDDVTLTAEVTGGAPTGDVDFRADGRSLGVVSLRDGAAELTVGDLPAGRHAITVQYAGDGNHTESASETVVLDVQGASEDDATAAPARLPETGGDVVPGLFAGGALLAGGALIGAGGMLGARRARSRP
ncbi:Ig-like domain-containing protein [Leucobacter triazinivorans]|nr:Ig-like domain-containing protein [Leucobacter triazinivorans]